MSRCLAAARQRDVSVPDRCPAPGLGERTAGWPSGPCPAAWQRDMALGDEAVTVAREEGRLADVGGSDEPRGPALEPEREAAVGRHPVAEGLQVPLVRLDVPVE